MKGEKTMTYAEITKKIDELERALFLLNMKDTWTGKDYQRERDLENAIAKYEKMIVDK
jgi:ribosomal protein L29